jgi:RNAse (barnase) inhibitor barstar
LNLVEQLADLGAAGVYQLAEPLSSVENAAQENEFALWRVDCATMRSKEDLLRGIAEALRFPAWFGENWDALEDCLTDLSWSEAAGYVLVLDNCAALSRAEPEVFETALEIFDSAAEYWYDEEVPFWVFVAGADPEQFDLPPAGQG